MNKKQKEKAKLFIWLSLLAVLVTIGGTFYNKESFAKSNLKLYFLYSLLVISGTKTGLEYLWGLTIKVKAYTLYKNKYYEKLRNAFWILSIFEFFSGLLGLILFFFKIYTVWPATICFIGVVIHIFLFYKAKKSS